MRGKLTSDCQLAESGSPLIWRPVLPEELFFPFTYLCRRFAVNQARLRMEVMDHKLLHMLRQFYLSGEKVKRSIGWLIKRLIKVGAKVAYHGRRWRVHVASAFPLVRYYQAVFG